MARNTYSEYKKIKSVFSDLKYRDYPLDRVLGSYLAAIKWTDGFKSKLVLILSWFFKKYIVKNDEPNCILYTYTIERDDYHELINAARKNQNQTKVIKIERHWIGTKDLLSYLSSLVVAIKFAITTKSSLFERFYIVLFCTLAVKTIKDLENSEIKAKEYVAFNSSYLFESYLSFYFRNRNVNTYSLQHGMYFEYQNDVVIDVINYENICADKLKCWGKYSLSQIKSFVPSDVTIEVAGYPKETLIKDDRYKVNKIYVLLPRKPYINDIYVLLRQLQSMDCQFLIRPHPSIYDEVNVFLNEAENLELDSSKSMVENLQQKEYLGCLGFNSTAVFEAIQFKQKVIQYRCGNDEFFIDNIPVLDGKNIKNVFLPKFGKILDSSYYFS